MHLEPDSQPTIWGGYRAAQSGPAPQKLQDCRDCQGIGRVSRSRPCARCVTGDVKHVCAPCPACKGKARRWYDDYLGVAVEAAPERKQGQGSTKRRRRHVSRRDLSDSVVRWSEAREKRSKVFSELERQMRRLQSFDASAALLIVRIYVRAQPVGLSRTARVRIETGLVFLERGLQGLAHRLPQWLQEYDQTQAKAARAKRMKAQGQSLRAIQRELGCRKDQLRRLLAA